MTTTLILLFGWCLYWWGVAFVKDIMGDMIWDKDLTKNNLPPTIKALGILIVVVFYVATAPITKPFFWIQKEISKRRMRKAIANIEEITERNNIDLESLEELKQLVEKVIHQKDQDW